MSISIRQPEKGCFGSHKRAVEWITGHWPTDAILAQQRLAVGTPEAEVLGKDVARSMGRALAEGFVFLQKQTLALATKRAGHALDGLYYDGLWASFVEAEEDCRDELPAGAMPRTTNDDYARAQKRAREDYKRERAERRADGLPRFPTYLTAPEQGAFEAAEVAHAEREAVEATLQSVEGGIAFVKRHGAPLATMLLEVFTAAFQSQRLAIPVDEMAERCAAACGWLEGVNLTAMIRKVIEKARACCSGAEAEGAFMRLLATEGVAAPGAATPAPLAVVAESPMASVAPLSKAAAREAEIDALEARSSPAEVPPPLAASTEGGPGLPALQVDENVDPFGIAALPGILGMTARWMLASAYRPIPEFAVMSALAFCATLFGRKYETPTGIGLNLYLIGLAGASFGKEDLVGLPQKLLLETGNHHLLGPGDITSDSSIETTLRDRPCFLMPMDEIGVFLQGMNGRNAGGWEKRIRKSILELYSKSHQTWTGKQRASSDRINAAQPFYCPTVNILGAAVEDGFYAGMDEQNLADGMFARLTVIKASGRPSRNSRRGKVIVPAELKDAITNALRDRYEGGGDLVSENHRDPFVAPDLRGVEWGSDDVRDAWEQIEERQDEAIERDPSLKGIIGRVAAQTLKLASLRAIAANPKAPRVQADDVAWGYALVSRSINTIQSGVADHMAGSDFEVLCKTIHRYAREAHPASIAWSALMRKKGVSKAEPRLVRAAIERLVEQRFIYDPKIGGERGGGPGMRVTARFE